MPDCCPVNVCLNFTEVTATPEFKEQMKELFCEIFEDICGDCEEGCCPDTPVVDGKIDMCLDGNTISVSVNACKGIKTAGGTCGACPV